MVSKRSRILLADDHEILREGLHRLLEHDFDVVGAASDGCRLIEQALALNPDVIVTDISMPMMSGLEAARAVRKVRPNIKFVFLTVHRENAYLNEAFRSGASAYLLKRSASRELIEAIRAVLAGRTYAPSMDPQFLPDTEPLTMKNVLDLTVRQKQILQLLTEGRSLKEIAAVLDISIKTVEFHKARLGEKLYLKTTAQLVRYAIENGIT